MSKKIEFILLLVYLLLPFKTFAISTPALSQLEVETDQGTGKFDLSTGATTFSFSLSTSLDYANIIVKPVNDSYTVTGGGKVKCEKGLNKIVVVVTDPSDNSSVTYTINLNFNQTASESDGKTNPNTGTFLNISLLGFGSCVAIAMINKSKKHKFGNI